MFIKTIFKLKELEIMYQNAMLKELEIMYQNAMYICISWHSKIYWYSMKKCWFQQNSRGVSRDS